MATPLTLTAAAERAAAAARHGWGNAPTVADLAALADAHAGLHAARLLTPYVTAHTRNPAFTPDQLRAALAPGGDLVKIRCMRRTLHLWPLTQAADAHVATRRLRLGATAATARRHGLDPSDLRRWAHRTVAALSGGPVSYRDAQELLAKQHPTATVESVRLGIKWAWESGWITCHNTAASLHREQRQFALVEHAHPGLDLNSTEPDRATIALIRRYLRAYGPAAPGDLAWWSGLTRAELAPALTALRDQITPVRVEGLPGELLALADQIDQLRAADSLPADHVRLHAWEDPALKGYGTTRARYLDPSHVTQAFNSIGEVRATITVAGRIAGVWSWDKQHRGVTAEFFTRLPRSTKRAAQQRLNTAEAFLRAEPS